MIKVERLINNNFLAHLIVSIDHNRTEAAVESTPPLDLFEKKIRSLSNFRFSGF